MACALLFSLTLHYLGQLLYSHILLSSARPSEDGQFLETIPPVHFRQTRTIATR